MNEEPKFRRIRSFVRREGRLTTSQKDALSRLWPRFGLDPSAGTVKLAATFGRVAPCILEIGYGMGASLISIAEANPDKDYIGIEVHRPGVGALLKSIEERNLTNIRTFNCDAVEVLQQNIPDSSLDGLYLFFPDPWHKKRHHKRRIVQPDFLQLVAGKMKAGAILHLATDWENYAKHMMVVASASDEFANPNGADCYAERPAYRPLTKFEQRGQRLGHGVWDLIFTRTPGA